MVGEGRGEGGRAYGVGWRHCQRDGGGAVVPGGGAGGGRPLLETSAMLHEGAAKSSRIERMSGYAELVMDRCAMNENDCFLAVSSSVINPFTIQMSQPPVTRRAPADDIPSFKYMSNPPRHDAGPLQSTL